VIDDNEISAALQATGVNVSTVEEGQLTAGKDSGKLSMSSGRILL